MVGSSLIRLLKNKNYKNVITKSREELNLLKQGHVNEFFNINKPDYVFICAAKVGGIYANNKYRADFIYENLQIQNNLIHYAHLNNVKKLIFLGSSCIYPKNCKQPMKEEYLLNGVLEHTNEPYAIAKIAGIKLCESYFSQYDKNFFSLMPTNLFGPHDNFHPDNSHVLPALIRKFYTAKYNHDKSVTVWGSGSVSRELMFVDYLADACYYFMKNINAKDIYDFGISHINIGSGVELTIKQIAQTVRDISKFSGKIDFDRTMPDGVRRKLLDCSKAKSLGWKVNHDLVHEISNTYNWYVENYGVQAVE